MLASLRPWRFWWSKGGECRIKPVQYLRSDGKNVLVFGLNDGIPVLLLQVVAVNKVSCTILNVFNVAGKLIVRNPEYVVP